MVNKNFYLSSIPEIKINEEYNFSYAEVSGYAEIVGCKIVFFRKNKSDLLDAFSFIEIEPEEFDFCNYILEKINFPVKFGDNFFKNYKRYNFHEKNSFMSFCIGDNGVVGIEVIFNPEIIDKISDFR